MTLQQPGPGLAPTPPLGSAPPGLVVGGVGREGSEPPPLQCWSPWRSAGGLLTPPDPPSVSLPACSPPEDPGSRPLRPEAFPPCRAGARLLEPAFHSPMRVSHPRGDVSFSLSSYKKAGPQEGPESLRQLWKEGHRQLETPQGRACLGRHWGTLQPRVLGAEGPRDLQGQEQRNWLRREGAAGAEQDNENPCIICLHLHWELLENKHHVIFLLEPNKK